MRRLVLPTMLLAAGLMSCASGGSAPGQAAAATIRGAPSWFRQVSRGNRYLEGRATAVSRDMQLAVDNGAAEARVQIAQEVETFVGAVLTRATEQAGESGNESATRTSDQLVRQVSAVTLRGLRVDRQEVTPEPDGRFRAWVRIRLPRGEVQAALQVQAQREEALYARLRNTDAFRELEMEAGAFRADSGRVR